VSAKRKGGRKTASRRSKPRIKAGEPLAPELLYQAVDLDSLKFESTEDLKDFKGVLGQPRAVEAVEFGVEIDAEGYNLFALGPPGTGKHSLLESFFAGRAQTKPIPDDWCYVNNFEQPHNPHAIRLPAGRGAVFVKDMDSLVEEVQTALETAFEGEEYQNRRHEIQEKVQSEQEKALDKLRERADAEGFTLLRTPSGLGFAPVKDGEVVEPDAYNDLSEEERQAIEGKVTKLQSELQRLMRQLPRLQREAQENLRQLNKEIAHLAVGGLIEERKGKYEDLPVVVGYLEAVEDDIIENVRDFLPQDESDGQSSGEAMLTSFGVSRGQLARRRYKVNLIIDHSQSEHGPVITEDNPTYANLIGRVEHVPQMGALLTDFNLIKAGALHRANGGYLLLDARKVLLQPYAWEGLKRALHAQEIRIESPGQAYGLITTISLEPEPIPLDVKLALVGDRSLYYMLDALDPEFGTLFKVMADFDGSMDRDRSSQRSYARLLARLVRKEGLRPFKKDAIGRVIERSARMVGDSEKLSTQMRLITDLLREADYWAGHNGNGMVTAADVQKALDAKIHRADRLREKSQESILRQTILIDTKGEKVGQVNGLSVMMLGDFAFGRPSRITARVRMGSGEVVDIEREAELGGPLHAKGVMILAGFLGERYAEQQPLSLSASLVFEQTYGGIEGDSASSAELYALLSAIGDLPLRQSLAVTGSVNQRGEVQAIGGANEKIEGFFDICQQRGLTGEQGVLIPTANVKHLMLRQDVIDAVKAGKFHVYPVETVDQGIELLAGLPAGKRGADGEYPADSVNGRVQAAITQLAERRQGFLHPDGREPS
jgi:lon-related putative ATP-dependent protease